MTQIPAAWYADPAGSGQLRYWDGAAWTTHLRSPEPIAVQQPAPLNFPPPVQQPYQPGSYSPRVDPYAQTTERSDSMWVIPGVTQGDMKFVSGITDSVVAGQRVTGVIGAIVLVVIGVLGLTFSGTVFDQFGSASAPAAGSIETTGTVVELEMNEGACSPIVEFSADGQTYRAYSSVSQSPCPYTIGDAATLTYLPSSPESSARLSSDADALQLFRIVAYVIFGAMVLIGAFSALRAFRR